MRPVIAPDTVTVVTTVVRDSMITLPADSSVIRAWFECDSLNQVIMTQLEEIAGNTIKPTTIFNSGFLTVTAKIDSQALYLQWKERHDSTSIHLIKEVPVEKIVYKKPAWLLWISGIGAGAIFIIILLIILKLK